MLPAGAGPDANMMLEKRHHAQLETQQIQQLSTPDKRVLLRLDFAAGPD
jgi:hypothetical protein